MPTVLQLNFPGGRYHATPWGHHVNEGLVEWPPSPWRLLRALLATGFTKAGWDPAGPPPSARAMIASLAVGLPSYFLPPTSVAHSRHYVTAAEKKPLIMDTWAQVFRDGRDPLLEVVWPIDLPPDQRMTLIQLAGLLGYLGRAESLVEAQFAERPLQDSNCVPATADSAPPGSDWELVRVLCIQPSHLYDSWRKERTAPIDAALPLAPGKKVPAKLLKERAKALEPYPPDLIAALCVETGALQRNAWSSAPGTRVEPYWRRAGALEVGAVIRPRIERPPSVPFVLFALSTDRRNASALPMVERVFAQGRLLHKAIAAAVERTEAHSAAMVLLGRNREQIASTGHGHTHLLHLDLDGDQHLDHVLLWAPTGFDGDAQRALRAVRRTWMKGSVGDLQVALCAVGGRQILRTLDQTFGGRLSTVLGPPGGARRWVSTTPFIAPRLTKRRGKDSLEGQIQFCLERRGFPLAEIEILDARDQPRLSFRHFVLSDHRHTPPRAVAHSVRLTFASPVDGPLCLGYGSHYGLGRFEVFDP